MPPEISPAAYFIGTILFVVISSFINQKTTSRKISASNKKTASAAQEIDDTVTNLNAQITDLKKDIEDVKSERDKANERAGKLQTQIDQLNDDIKGLKATNTQAALDMIQLTKERDEATSKYHGLNEQYKKVLEDSISMGKQIASLQDEMDALRIDIKAYKRVDEIVVEMRTAIKEGVQQALSTSEMMKIANKVEGNPT